MPNPLDPSTLSDEELDKLIDGEEPADKPVDEPDAPAPDDKPDESEEDEADKPDAPEDDESEEEEEEKPKSRREELRIQQLIAKMKQTPEKKEAPKADPKSLNYADELDADPELIKRLEADRQQSTDSAYERAIRETRTMQWETLLNIDSPQIASKYSQLNPNDKEHFHKGVYDALTGQYLAMVGYDPETKTVANPTLRWGEFAEGMMELANEIASNEVVTATKNIKSQAAKTGLRPDGSSSKKLNLNQAPGSMSDEELDAIIAQAIPSR